MPMLANSLFIGFMIFAYVFFVYQNDLIAEMYLSFNFGAGVGKNQKAQSPVSDFTINLTKG